MLAYLFVVVAVAVRLLPHPWAFTPLGAALLYFGARGPRKQFWVPLALLAVADVWLTRSAYSYPLTLDHLVTWGWYAAALWIGTLLRRDARPLRVMGASLGASLSFFLASNFAVWAVWNMYPKTLGGLLECYVAAVPFARNFAADLFFSAVMFGIAALLAHRQAEAARRACA